MGPATCHLPPAPAELFPLSLRYQGPVLLIRRTKDEIITTT